MPPRASRLTVALAAAFLFPFAGVGFAQSTAAPSPTPVSATSTAPANEEGDVVVLSPFNVDASADEGYRATSTLAGSRINTNLRDVASSVTVITPQFLKDTAAVDINDVFLYTANTEGTHNFTDAPAQGIGGFLDRPASSPATANRVRGLNSATLTRDYFLSVASAIGFDSYNTDRITLNRGPNSILFGLGQPSGIVDFSPKRAGLERHAHEVGFRYGSHGDLRATLDINRVIVADTLAFRANVLLADRGFAQEPAYFKDRRGYFAATYKPFPTTTLQIGYEYVNQDSNNPNTVTPTDHVTQWIAAGRPTWDPSTDLWDNRPAGFATQTGGSPVGATAPDGSLEYVFDEGQGQMSWAAYWQQNVPGVSIYNSIGLSDDRYAPMHRMNLLPTFNEYDLGALTLNWDQQVAKGLFFNVAYFKEDFDRAGLGGVRSNQYGIFVDVNERLPNGTVNPHFGETYIPQRSLDMLTGGNVKNESYRGTVNYQLDLREQPGWLRHLGRHMFTAYAERREVDSWSEQYNGTRADIPSYLNASNRLDSADWQITRLRYLGGTADSRAIHAPVRPAVGVGGIPNTYYNATAGAWANDTWSEFFALKRRDLNRTKITSSAQVWQSYWLDGKIVGTLGWRQDKNHELSRSFTQPAPGVGYVVRNDSLPEPGDADYRDAVSGDTTTVGVVVHPLSWLSLHYNESKNFQPLAGDVNIFGEPIPPPSGEGKDWGFSLDLLEGRLNVRVNWYELSAANARITNQGPDILAQWELPWFDQVVIPALATQYGLTHTSADFFSPIAWGDNKIEETADQVSEGLEIELTANPTRNWRIMASVSQQEARKSNIGAALSRWVEDVLPGWQSQPWWDGPATTDAGWGVNANLQGYFAAFNTGRVLPTYKSEEGLPSPALREWRANIINNYSFTEGRFKGWNFGGAVRWEDEAAIGHPAVIENGLLVGLDLDNPYTDGGDTQIDLWAGYTTRIWNDRVTWNVQLNVRDVTNSKGFEPIVANSNGTPAVFRIEFGPTWYLSSTFNF